MAATLINPLYPRPFYPGGGTAVATGYMLTVSSTTVATSFTTSSFTYAGAGSAGGNAAAGDQPQLVFLDVQAANVLVTFDGTSGSLYTRGHNLAAGTNYTWQVGTVLNANFVLAAGTTTGYIYASQFAV